MSMSVGRALFEQTVSNFRKLHKILCQELSRVGIKPKITDSESQLSF